MTRWVFLRATNGLVDLLGGLSILGLCANIVDEMDLGSLPTYIHGLEDTVTAQSHILRREFHTDSPPMRKPSIKCRCILHTPFPDLALVRDTCNSPRHPRSSTSRSSARCFDRWEAFPTPWSCVPGGCA